ncbi:MAG TPA: VTC domain-containing protein [Myxococcales bacterium]|nr:VTC domain-containing protein [Myxococcales bacterium]
MPVAFAEGRITKLRREAKLALALPEAAALRARLAAEVGAPAVSRIVSVYFDGPGWPLAARAAAAPHDTVKLRFKEYFPDRGRSGGGRVVLELKREAGGVTRKERLWVPRDRLEAVLRDPEDPALRAWMGDCPLVPAVAVSYEREVYQGDETWRVTVDSGVEFFRIDPRLALSAEPLRRELLGEPAGREDRTIVELKHLESHLPSWLAAHGGARGYSKFAQAMRCVHGVGEARAAVG